MIVNINGKEFAWGDIKIAVGSVPISGIRGIEYEEEQDKEHYYGAGSEPQSIQPGNKKYTGTLTINQNTVIALQAATPTGSILDLIGNITVCWSNAGQMYTDILIGVEFTKVPKGMKQGDKASEHALPFIFLGIQPNA